MITKRQAMVGAALLTVLYLAAVALTVLALNIAR